MENAPFTISFWGFGFSIQFLIPEFLSCKQIIANIRKEMKSKDSMEKIDEYQSDDSL